MKKLTTILVALAAMLALAAPAMAQDCAALSGQAEEDCWTQGALKEFAGESNPSGIPPASASATASPSASASTSASASASASTGHFKDPDKFGGGSFSASPSASASASPSQYQYSAPEKPSATLPDTGGSRLLLLFSGLAVVTGGALFGYLVRRYSH